MRNFQPIAIASALLVTVVLADPSDAQLFLQRNQIAADATGLEHAVKKLASRDTKMATVNDALKKMAKQCEKFSWLAQRQGSYYALQRDFDKLTQAYASARNLIENYADWTQGSQLTSEWRTVQTRFDKIYYDLYGYDFLDPYFGRHPDFAATPVPIRIPVEGRGHKVPSANYEIRSQPIRVPSYDRLPLQTRGKARQF